MDPKCNSSPPRVNAVEMNVVVCQSYQWHPRHELDISHCDFQAGAGVGAGEAGLGVTVATVVSAGAPVLFLGAEAAARLPRRGRRTLP